MSSHNKIRRLVQMGLLIAIAMSLSYFERFIPLPYSIPGLKLGLANIVTMIGIFYFKRVEVFTIVVVRVILASLVLGSMMGFFYSLAGGLLSFVGMSLVYHFFKKYVSVIGISIFGAVLHNIGQLSVLAIVSSRITIAVSYTPILMVTGVITGIFVGLASRYFLEHTRRIFASGI